MAAKKQAPPEKARDRSRSKHQGNGKVRTKTKSKKRVTRSADEDIQILAESPNEEAAESRETEEVEERRSSTDEDKENEARSGRKKGKKEDMKKRRRKEEDDDEEGTEERGENENALYRFPMNRVSRIIKSENPDLKISQESVFVINRAAEKFLQLYCREAYACAFLDQKNYTAYNHMSSVVSKRERFKFLSDFVPEKVKAEDALAQIPKTEKETNEIES